MTTQSVVDGSLAKRKVSLQPVSKFKCDARCCCVLGDVVWVAELKGGIAVCDAKTGELLARVPIEGADTRLHFKCMALVHEEIWAGCSTGTVQIFDAQKRHWKHSLSIVGVQMRAPITSISFDGHSVIGGSETGRVVQWDPFSKRQVMTFVALAPVMAVTFFASFVVSGDRDGAVQLWDARGGEVVVDHIGKSSGVTSLLGEPLTETLWVGRCDGSISVYAFTAAAEEITEMTERRSLSLVTSLSVGDDRVTSMLTVSGKVLVTTYDRTLVVFSATTREVLSRVVAAHEAFIFGSTKVYTAETVRAWTFGNDSTIRVWDIPGYYVPCQSVPHITPHEQAAMVNTGRGLLSVQNAHLSCRIAASQAHITDLQEKLRQVKDEAHELRMRHSVLERSLQEKDVEINARDTRIKEYEEKIKSIHKDLDDANARVNTAEREATMLRADYNAAQKDASQARTQISTKITEKAEIEQRLLAQSTEKSQMEVRLRDKEGELTRVKTENERLQRLLADCKPFQETEMESQRMSLAKGEAAVLQELEELRKRNYLLGSLMASMEYTIRRKEEEERDMTALLNAFRRKAAGTVTDEHLSALLQLTMLRNPNRFDMECDEHTKSLLCGRNGPFVGFLQRLREVDPTGYRKLVDYLQRPTEGPGFNGIFAQLMELAAKEGGGGESDIVMLKKSLPSPLNSLNIMDVITQKTNNGGEGDSSVRQPTSVGCNVTVLPSHQPPLPPSFLTTATTAPAAAAVAGAASSIKGSADVQSFGNVGAPHVVHEGESKKAISEVCAATAAHLEGNIPGLGSENELTTLLKGMKLSSGYMDPLEPRASGVPEDVYVKQLRSTFEFILQTRHSLVEQLGVLLKRVVKARQVLDALTSNAKAGPFPASRRVSMGTNVNNRHSAVFTSAQILEELHRIISGIVVAHLTATEKQRLGIGA